MTPPAACGRFAVLSALVLALLLSICSHPRSLFAQTPALQITGSPDGIIVLPGQVVVVDVSVATNIDVSGGVTVIGELPLGFTDPSFRAPFSFVLTVPTTADPRPYAVTALGFSASGTLVSSQSIALFVERADRPINLRVEPSLVQFQFPGGQAQLRVLAQFSDGSTVAVTESTQTTYVSGNALTASVDVSGVVTAMGQSSGNRTAITVGYGGLTATVPVTVRRSIPGDLNGDGVVDRNDLNIRLDDLNTPAAGSFDARDLNGDGVIDALDARTLFLLCTRPGCATQ